MKKEIISRVFLLVAVVVLVGVLFLVYKDRLSKIDTEVSSQLSALDSSQESSVSTSEKISSNTTRTSESNTEATISTTTISTSPPTTSFVLDQTQFEKSIYALINDYRSKQGLNTFWYYDALEETVKRRAKEFSITENFQREDGRGYESILDEQGFKYDELLEIHSIAHIKHAPEDVFQAWLADEANKANILRANFDSVAISTHVIDEKLYSLVFLLDSSSEPAEPPISEFSHAETLSLIHQHINKARTDAGLGTVKQSQALNSAAQIRVSEIQARYDHYRSDATAWHTVLKDFNIKANAYVEMFDFTNNWNSSPRDIVRKWLNNNYRNNILNANYSQVGFAVAEANGGLYIEIILTN